MQDINYITDDEYNPALRDDKSLVKSISQGSLPAWHEFLNRYAGLIYSVIRRHLFSEDKEEVRNVYVDVLKTLYEGDLFKFRIHTSLSTSLIVYARSRALDHYRKLYGRHRTPKGYHNLSKFDQRVLQLFYVERLSFEIIIQALLWDGYRVEVHEVVESIRRIENTIDRRYLNRLDRDHHANTRSVKSNRMLRYLIQIRMEYDERMSRERPDAHLIEKETQETTARIRTALVNMSAEERQIIFLRFHKGLSAKQIAERLNLSGQRRVYTLIGKALRKLRKRLSIEEGL